MIPFVHYINSVIQNRSNSTNKTQQISLPHDKKKESLLFEMSMHAVTTIYVKTLVIKLQTIPSRKDTHKIGSNSDINPILIYGFSVTNILMQIRSILIVIRVVAFPQHRHQLHPVIHRRKLHPFILPLLLVPNRRLQKL